MICGSGRFPGEGISYPFQYSWAFLVAQLVKNLPTMPETWIQALGWEYPLEAGVATHSNILAWRIPMDRGAWGLQSMGSQRARHDCRAECSAAHVYYIAFVIKNIPIKKTPS